MEFIYGKQNFISLDRVQENCYLLTNGLGGYSSLTMAGSCTRNDHALLMAAVTPPCERFHVLSKIDECIKLAGKSYSLATQEYIDVAKNEKGFVYLDSFRKDVFPVWTFRVPGIEIQKSVVMKHGENTLALRYQIKNETTQQAELAATPWFQFAPKGKLPRMDQRFETEEDTIKSNGKTLYYRTDGKLRKFPKLRWMEDCYYAHDSRDGRDSTGRAAASHQLIFYVAPETEQEFFVIYSMDGMPEESVESLFLQEETRLCTLEKQSGIRDSIGRQLVRSGDCFLTDRASTGEKTIIAGYPFFGDWGRDTMIAVTGIGITSRRYEETKSIFRSFMQYCRHGLMPNMFPESGQDPMYNTVDASLLFIMAVYEYYQSTKDTVFLEEAYSCMEEIIDWYRRGTDFHIRMEEDGLLRAGEALEQVTWMDIRYEDILPTPRHGKPVEINAWWYNALRMMEAFTGILQRKGAAKKQEEYCLLADRVRESFQREFWNEEAGCLKDTVSGNASDLQIRSNQIWAVSAAFSILTSDREKQVVKKVYEHLYTPCGLRTLSPEDPEFHPVYQGSMYERDMAYHQGTVWPFPMGGYYLAYLKVHEYREEAKLRVRSQLEELDSCLREGCVGQLPEVYDGLVPGISRGCFAQAWSVGELLRVYAELERIK
ncbi:MAG: amylo-alpha-1,6-glucosidase [Lachnospiraceae bacterium]|nr:amylo-alpha-1,6-glucosidase [Lachnospiraceae bacterium]